MVTPRAWLVSIFFHVTAWGFGWWLAEAFKW